MKRLLYSLRVTIGRVLFWFIAPVLDARQRQNVAGIRALFGLTSASE